MTATPYPQGDNPAPAGRAAPLDPHDARDSGTRDISGLAVNGWVIGAALVRRVGALVMLSMSGVDGTSSTATTCIEIPSGFQRLDQVSLAVNQASGTPSATATDISIRTVAGSGAIRLAQTVTAGRWVLTYLTDDDWPAELPGVAA